MAVMKKFFLGIIFLMNGLCFSQVINQDYFPVNNEIDREYEIENQTWTNNYEWNLVINKFTGLWKNQMYLEMERLISVVPESATEIKRNQKKWEEVIAQDFQFVDENVDYNLVGREIYIGQFGTERLRLYKNRAMYYLCLYYSIKDRQSDFFYTDFNEPELAK